MATKANWLPIKSKHFSIIIKIPFSTLGSTDFIPITSEDIFNSSGAYIRNTRHLRNYKTSFCRWCERVKKCYDNDTLHSIYLSIAVVVYESIYDEIFSLPLARGGRFVQLVNFVIVTTQKNQKDFSPRFYREIITDLMKIIIIYLLYRA